MCSRETKFPCGNVMCFPINMEKYVPKRGLMFPHGDVNS